MEKFRNLKVWQKAHALVIVVYKITKLFPSDERFGLTSQMRRAIVSVAANIVEGSKRKTNKDQRHFCYIADTSLEELKYYLILSHDLDYLSKEEGKVLMEQCREVGRMLDSLIKFYSL